MTSQAHTKHDKCMLLARLPLTLSANMQGGTRASTVTRVLYISACSLDSSCCPSGPYAAAKWQGTPILLDLVPSIPRRHSARSRVSALSDSRSLPAPQKPSRSDALRSRVQKDLLHWRTDSPVVSSGRRAISVRTQAVIACRILEDLQDNSSSTSCHGF